MSEPSGVFEPTPDGLAERLGGHLRTHRPVVAGSAVVIAGYVVMAALVIGLGLIITKWLAGGPVGTWEDSVNRWFVEQRTTTLDSVSRVGSDLGASGPNSTSRATRSGRRAANMPAGTVPQEWATMFNRG